MFGRWVPLLCPGAAAPNTGTQYIESRSLPHRTPEPDAASFACDIDLWIMFPDELSVECRGGACTCRVGRQSSHASVLAQEAGLWNKRGKRGAPSGCSYRAIASPKHPSKPERGKQTGWGSSCSAHRSYHLCQKLF